MLNCFWADSFLFIFTESFIPKSSETVLWKKFFLFDLLIINAISSEMFNSNQHFSNLNLLFYRYFYVNRSSFSLIAHSVYSPFHLHNSLFDLIWSVFEAYYRLKEEQLSKWVLWNNDFILRFFQVSAESQKYQINLKLMTNFKFYGLSGGCVYYIHNLLFIKIAPQFMYIHNLLLLNQSTWKLFYFSHRK